MLPSFVKFWQISRTICLDEYHIPFAHNIQIIHPTLFQNGCKKRKHTFKIQSIFSLVIVVHHEKYSSHFMQESRMEHQLIKSIVPNNSTHQSKIKKWEW
jgi:hypothetical protein